MSAAVLTDVTLLLGASDITSYTGSFDVGGEAAFKPARNFGAKGYEVLIPGVFTGTASLKGNADFASAAVSSTFNSSAAGTQQALSIMPTGSAAAAGDTATLLRGRLVSGRMAAGAVGETSTFELTMTTDDAEVDGYVAAPLASRTTAGLTGTAINIVGPSASQKLYAALHITAASGTNLAVKVQSDDNSGFTSPTDRITFTTVSATGWQWSSVAGNLATETYWRAVATIATGTFSFAVTFGVL